MSLGLNLPASKIAVESLLKITLLALLWIVHWWTRLQSSHFQRVNCFLSSHKAIKRPSEEMLPPRIVLGGSSGFCFPLERSFETSSVSSLVFAGGNTSGSSRSIPSGLLLKYQSIKIYKYLYIQSQSFSYTVSAFNLPLVLKCSNYKKGTHLFKMLEVMDHIQSI